jgi:hypothetical protein
MDATVKKSEFGENVKQYDVLNQCRRCGIRAGKYTKKDTGETVGVFLLKDKRGFMICNLCKDAGFFVEATKMTKGEKKKFKKLKHMIQGMRGIPHVTLDAQGNEVL